MSWTNEISRDLSYRCVSGGSPILQQSPVIIHIVKKYGTDFNVAVQQFHLFQWYLVTYMNFVSINSWALGDVAVILN